MLKYEITRVTYSNNNNDRILLFYNVILANLLTYNYASNYYRTTYAIVNKNNRTINN